MRYMRHMCSRANITPDFLSFIVTCLYSHRTDLILRSLLFVLSVWPFCHVGLMRLSIIFQVRIRYTITIIKNLISGILSQMKWRLTAKKMILQKNCERNYNEIGNKRSKYIFKSEIHTLGKVWHEGTDSHCI